MKIAGSKKLKRQMAPTFWGITRKDKRFAVTVKPGPHKKDKSIPIAIFLRDMLKIVSDLREAKFAIYGGKVSIDGVKIKSLHHGIGLMDIIQLDGIKEIYRLVPQNGTKKLVIVASKTTIKNGKTQIGFNDGRSLIDESDVKLGDSCVIQVPEQKILEIIKMEKDSEGLIMQGINAGQIGKIIDIKEGTFVLPKRVVIKLGERQIEIPANLVMSLGKEKPPIQIR